MSSLQDITPLRDKSFFGTSFNPDYYQIWITDCVLIRTLYSGSLENGFYCFQENYKIKSWRPIVNIC